MSNICALSVHFTYFNIFSPLLNDKMFERVNRNKPRRVKVNRVIEVRSDLISLYWQMESRDICLTRGLFTVARRCPQMPLYPHSERSKRGAPRSRICAKRDYFASRRTLGSNTYYKSQVVVDARFCRNITFRTMQLMVSRETQMARDAHWAWGRALPIWNTEQHQWTCCWSSRGLGFTHQSVVGRLLMAVACELWTKRISCMVVVHSSMKSSTDAAQWGFIWLEICVNT